MRSAGAPRTKRRDSALDEIGKSRFTIGACALQPSPPFITLHGPPQESARFVFAALVGDCRILCALYVYGTSGVDLGQVHARDGERSRLVAGRRARWLGGVLEISQNRTKLHFSCPE